MFSNSLINLGFGGSGGNRLPPGYIALFKDGVDTVGLSISRYTRQVPSITGNIYYVSPLGSDTAPYDTWAKAAKLPSTAHAHGVAAASSQHIMFCAPGTYVDALLFNSTKWNDSLVFGTAAHGSILPAAKGQVVFSSPSTFTTRITAAQRLVLESLSITQSGSSIPLYLSGGLDTIGRNLLVFDPTGDVNLLNVTASGSMWHGCSFRGASAVSAVEIYGTAGAVFNFCDFGNSDTKIFGSSDGIKNGGSGTITLNNCLVGGSGTGAALKNTSTGPTVANNCVLLPKYGPSGYLTSATGAGAITLNNCVSIRGWSVSHALHEGNVVVNNSIEDSSPGLQRHSRSGALVFSIDDLYVVGRVAYVLEIEQVLADRGLKGTWYIDSKSLPGNEAALREIASRGVIEIAAHSHSHTTLTATGALVTITKSGATINIDRAANTITVNPGGIVSGFKQKTLGAIYTELTALGCTQGSLNANVHTDTLGESMTDSSGAQASPYTVQLLLDSTAQTGYYWVEMTNAKALIEAVIQPTVPAYSCRTFATPGGTSNTAVNSAIKNAGFIGNRNGFNGASLYLSSIDAFSRGFMQWDLYFGNTLAEMRTNFRSLCEAVAEYGLCVDILSHQTSEATPAEWGTILDLIIDEYPEISIKSHAEFVGMLSSAPWSTADQQTYTRQWIGNPDYRLRANSPAVNTGISPFVHGNGDQYDADGYQVWDDTYNIPDGHWIDGVDIGPYAYGGSDKVYTRLTIVSGTGPSDWVVKLPAAPDIIAILGLDSTWYDASAVPKEVAFLSLGDDAKIFDGDKGQVVIYSIDMSAQADKIHRVIGASS